VGEARAATLLARLQSLIERTYGHEGAPDASRFVIGDAGLTRLYDASPDERRPMVLVRHVAGVHHVRVYYPDDLVARLEAHDPCRGVDETNLRDLGTFVEELDHFLLIAERVRLEREIAPIELELHANVTKVLVAWHFVARTLGVAQLDDPGRDAVRHELLERGDYDGEQPALRERYRVARRHALGFLHRVTRTPHAQRSRLLRTFSRASWQEKVALAG
jgi:hypothetical protein